jgi:hypothetical protein
MEPILREPFGVLLFRLSLKVIQMSVEALYEKARLAMGPDEATRLRRSRMRTVLMTRQLSLMAKQQRPTEEMLNRRCTI